jgi:hypothetical protein
MEVDEDPKLSPEVEMINTMTNSNQLKKIPSIIKNNPNSNNNQLIFMGQDDEDSGLVFVDPEKEKKAH